MLKTIRRLAIASTVLASSAAMPAFAQTTTFTPLSVGVASIVPHGDIVVYGPGVQKNVILMMKPGETWQVELSKSLSSANLQYSQRGHVIRITSLPGNDSLAETGGGEVGGTAVQAQSVSAAPQPSNIVASGLDIVSIAAPPPPPPTTPSEPITVEPGHVSPALVPVPQAPVPQAPVAPPVQTWTLMGGSLLSKDLIGWGQQAGWSVQWNMSQTPVVPSTTNITGDFKSAITEVVRAIRAEGVDIRVIFYNYPGSNTVVLTSASADNSGNAALSNANNQ